MIGKWRKYRKLSVEERAVLRDAFLLLPLTVFGVRLLGLERVRRWMARAGTKRGAHAADPSSIAVQTARAAAHFPFKPTCLERSLVLWRLLRMRGIAGELHIGVRPRSGAGGIDAHAWIEHDGIVINDCGDVKEHYAAFPASI